jgi:stage V sporulation protein SpoVS
MQVLRVRSEGETGRLARALLHALRENGGRAELRAIGPNAVHRAVKAVIAAGKAVQNDGRPELAVRPGFIKIQDGEGRELMALRFVVEERQPARSAAEPQNRRG